MQAQHTTQPVISSRTCDLPTDAMLGPLSCPCCGAVHCVPVGRKRGFGLNHCPACALVFVHPRPSPDQLKAIYAQSAGYFATVSVDLEESSNRRALWLDGLLCEQAVPKGRFLDVGCAAGAVPYHLRKLGWDTCGIEINKGAARVALAHGLDVRTEELAECSFPAGSFQVVHMGDVIEHLRSPEDTLAEIRRILCPGGMLVLSTPNSEAGFALLTLKASRLLGFPWPHSEAPYHLYEFSRRSLSCLLQKAGFDIVSITLQGRTRFSYIVGATGCFDALKAKMKQRGRYRLHPGFILSLPKLVCVTFALAPFYALGLMWDKFTDGGSSIVVIARRS